MPSWFEKSGTLATVRDFFRLRGIQAYLVGGYLRDQLLGRDSHDLDVAVTQEAIPLARELARILGEAFFALDEERDVGRIVLSDGKSKYLVDIARMRGTIEEDLALRDFTVDALAQDLADEDAPLIDPLGGQGDLRQGLIHTVSPQAFEEDPLRLLRAVRIAALLGFKIEAETREKMMASAHLIESVAGERVRDEMAHILLLPRSAPHLRLLHRLGVLTAAIPEMPSHLDLIGHILGAIEALEIALAGKESPWPEAAEYLDGEIAGGRPRSVLLKGAALLHHIDQVDEEHPPSTDQDSKLVKQVLEQLAFSSQEIRTGRNMLAALPRAWEILDQQDPSPLDIYRFFRDARGMGREAILLALGDQAASTLPGRLRGAAWGYLLDRAASLLATSFQRPDIVSPSSLINGEELMAALDLPPSPTIGRILEQIREAQVADRIRNKKEALDLAQDLLKERNQK